MRRIPTWIAALSYLAAPAAALAQEPGRYYGPHMWGGGWHGWFLGPIMMIAFVAVTVIVVVLLLRWLGGTGHGGAYHAPPGRPPLDILKERFARGEIDRDEYEERRKILEG